MRHHQSEVSYSVVTLCFVYGERENYNCAEGNADLRCLKMLFGGGSLSDDQRNPPGQKAGHLA